MLLLGNLSWFRFDIVVSKINVLKVREVNENNKGYIYKVWYFEICWCIVIIVNLNILGFFF